MALMDIDAVEWWSFELVREALVDAVVLWQRSPKAGHAPMRSCWPVDLMVRSFERDGDYDARGGLDSASEVTVRPLPLSRGEVDQRDRVSGWMMLVPVEADRRLLGVCLEFHARGYTQLPWAKIMRELGVKRGKDGLAKRYRASLRAIAEGLNAAEMRGLNVSRGSM